MTTTNNVGGGVINQKPDEKILVVARRQLFPEESFQGFLPIVDFSAYQELIMENRQFFWRSEMEGDPSFKQIIPYLVFCHEDRYFLMRRRGDASEARLKNKHTLGIGGHIRQEDMLDASLVTWAKREFAEEVFYDGALTITALGLINDETNAVGQVHTGFVFLLQGDTADISVKSELKEGELMSLEQMASSYENMETWSQMVFDFLVARQAAMITETLNLRSCCGK
jgi:predicted NUDIX family phosphoesterase